VYTEDAVKKHNTVQDCWVILHGKVYDVTNYLSLHPGGKQLIFRSAGKDITDDFEGMFHSIKARDIMEKYEVGALKMEKGRKRRAANQLMIPSRLIPKSNARRGLGAPGSGSKPQGGPYVFGAYGKLKPSTVGKGKIALHNEEKKGDDRASRFLSMTLKKVCKLNHNTSSFLFKLSSDIRVPLGWHIYALLQSGKNSFTKRPYTPTRCKNGMLELVVKLYPKGVLSQHIFGLNPGDLLKVSKPVGTFAKQPQLEQSNTILLLAGGTGITPLYSLLRHLEKVHYQRRISLLFWNKTKEDHFMQPELEKVFSSLEDGRLTFLTSKEDGRISKDLVGKLVDVKSWSEQSFIGICGPPAFNRAAERMLEDLVFAGVIHVFE